MKKVFHTAAAAVLGLSALTIAASSVLAADADSAKLAGWTEGAEVIHVEGKVPRIDMISGVIYSQIKSTRTVRQLRMTLEIPRTKVKKPAVIYFPGGGFTSADHEKFSEMRRALANAGFVVAAAEYRVVPDKFPAILEDAKSAVRYLRAHAAEYGIDPARIGVLGDSAGGYLSQMTGVTNGEKQFDKGDWLNVSSDVQAAVTIYGLSDLTTIGEGFGPEIDKVHESPASTEALLVNGPVDGSEPPFLILHGAQDPLVSPTQSAKLFRALKAKNVDAEYVLVDNAQHGDLPWFQKPVIERVVNWFVKVLKPVKAEEAEGAVL